MFDAPPEKPSQFALYWVALIALVGGGVGVSGAAWLLGEEWFQTNAVMFGSFFVGALFGGVIGWQFVMPKQPPSM